MSDRIKIKYWWSEDRKWFCVLTDDGINQSTVSLTPEEASLLSMNAALSEQSGPTAGREKGGSVCCYCDAPLSCAQCGMEQPDDTPSPPDRQQDQDETSVLPLCPKPPCTAFPDCECPIEKWQARDKIHGGAWIDVLRPNTNSDFEYRGLYASPPVSDASREAWRSDIENAPKDRPFLVYWNKSDIYGVLEWVDNKWVDQEGDEHMAFPMWQLFNLPLSPAGKTGGGN